MSDFPFNEQNEQMNDNTELENADALNTQGDDDVFSTIFSAPVEHRGKKAENVTKKKRWLAVVAAALAVAILVGGTFAVIKLIPVKVEDDLTSQDSETIEVLKIDADTVNSVTLTNSNGTFKFLPVRTEEKAEEEKESSVTTTWTVEGVDKKFTDSSAILSKVTAATEPWRGLPAGEAEPDRRRTNTSFGFLPGLRRSGWAKGYKRARAAGPEGCRAGARAWIHSDTESCRQRKPRVKPERRIR